MNVRSRFAEVVARAPDAVAVVDGDAMVSYADLARRADRVTESLRAAGVAEGTLVGLRLPRGVGFVAAVLGIWGAGCAYVPIDPAYPAERQDHIVTDARLRVSITADGGGEFAVTVREPRTEPHVVPAGTAYVIYTSGSTGAPKGVVVGHDHILAMLDSWYGVAEFGDEDVWTMFHSGSFDFSVWEMFGPLLSGGQVVVVPTEMTRDLAALAEMVAVEQVTVLGLVPTVFAHLVDALLDQPRRLPDLRYVILGGEALDLDVIARWTSAGLAPQTTIINDYGITETTVSTTTTVVDIDERDAWTHGTPIGTPLPHLDVVVVDDDLEPVGPGQPGEILISGASVAHGYLGRPELTARQFVRTRWGRAYRSGDHAVRGPDGALYFVGRQDRQVQLRGFRVELGEPEAVIRAHPDVAAAAVGLTSERAGEHVLTAVYVPEPGADLSPSRLTRYLTERLPRHLVPAKITSRERLPVSANGKVDVAAL